MYKAWYNHNIPLQMCKLFNKKKTILSGQLMNSLFPIYRVIMINYVMIIKVL